MFSVKQIRKVLLISLGILVVAGSTRAQPSGVTLWTPEVRVAEAGSVVVGTISKVVSKVFVPPAGSPRQGDPNTYIEHTITVKVTEVLKGDLKGTIDDLCARESLGFDKRYEEWRKAQTSFLWFIGSAPPGGRRGWHKLRLGKAVVAEDLFGARRDAPMFAMDLTVLKDEQEILAQARAFARTSRKVLPRHAIMLPPVVSRQCGSGGPWNTLLVPVEPGLEERAKRLIASPQDFVPKGEKLDPLGRCQLRFGGVDSLRYFKSDANAALLRSLLDDPLEDFQSGLLRQYPVRTKAYEILLHWNVDVPTPRSAEQMTALDLAGTDVTDASLKRVAELKNLATLDLQDTRVSDKGLKGLAGLKKLTALSLSETQRTDANLRVLREIGLLHVLSAATAAEGNRPKSVEDVVSLTLCRGPLTNAGLKELAGLKNLTWLDLRDTRVTDAGLKELAGLKNLTTLQLRGTGVTEAGIARLRQALPGCEIHY